MIDPRTPSAEDIRRLLPESLRRPAQEGARLMALFWLHQLSAARDTWRTLAASPSDALTVAAGDPFVERVAPNDHAPQVAADTLHRARVALRRLRATVRECDRVLDDAVDRRALRALRAVGQATNAQRDTDVQRAWLEAERDALPDAARMEATVLLQQLNSRPAMSVAAIERTFAKRLDPVVDRLSVALSRYTLRQRVGVDVPPPPLARHLSVRISRAGVRLRRELEQVTDVSSHDAMHAVRIRLKRQRALLAPFASQRPALGAWFDLATRGQDLLGAVRDAALLARRARKANLPALAATLHDVMLAHYAAFQHDWCARLDDVMLVIDAAAATLRREGSPVSRGGMPLEIERKYLLRGCPPAARAVAPLRIEQGWIPGEALRERLRRTVAADGTMTHWRTVKLGPAVARVEVEEAASAALFNAMWPLTQAARISKERYVIADGAHTWEIDVFPGRDLVLAEVELGAVDDTVTVPAWLAPYVERDVTGDPAYFNAVLARPEP